MRIFARIDNGIVMELFPPVPTPQELLDILPAGGDIRSMFGYDPDVWQEVTNVKPMPQERWEYKDGVFTAPAVVVPSAEQILAENTAARDNLLTKATLAISPLQDAVDLEDATTAETALLKKLKAYRVAVNRIDLTVTDPKWPNSPV